MSTKSNNDRRSFEEWMAIKEREREQHYGHLWKLPLDGRIKRWDELDKWEQRKIAEANSILSISNKAQYLAHIDIPSAVMLGVSFGLFMEGMMCLIAGIWDCLFDPTEWRSWVWLVCGTIVFGVSAVIGYILKFYWQRVVCKTGIFAPYLAGLGLFMFLLSLFSTMLATTELVMAVLPDVVPSPETSLFR